MKHAPLNIALFATLAGTAFGQSGVDLDRAYASELRTDAETRSSLLGNTNAAGLDVEVMMQARYMVNSRDERAGAPLGDSDTTIGFNIPRAQVRMTGAIPDANMSARLVFDFGAAELNALGTAGTATLLEANVAWSLEDWVIIVGQWHNPVVAEEAFAAEHGLAVERSATNEFFNPGYTQGVVFAYQGADNWRFAGAFSDGATYVGTPGTPNSPFNSAAENDFGITGRFDYLISGNWDQFSDLTSWRGSNYGVKVGLGGHYQTQGETNPSTFTNATLGAIDEMDIALWTADVMVQGDGWNVFAAYVAHQLEITPSPGPALPDITNHGGVIQGGLFVTDQTELFARWDAIFLDSDVVTIAGGTEDDYHFFTVGLNHYLVPESHAAKFTADIVYSAEDTDSLDFFSPVLGGNSPSTTGLLGNSDGEFLLRGQLTVVF